MDNNNFNQNSGHPASEPGKGKAITSMVLGIIAVVLCWFGYVAILSLVLAIVGLVLAISAKKDMKASGNFSARGMATAGLVLSIISLVLSAIVFLACTICIASVPYLY